jgi:predicted PurR-regulated permease PerM
MATTDWERRGWQAVVLIAIILAIGALHLARSAVVPVLFAMFLAMLLSPAVSALRRLRVPRMVAAAVVVASLIAVVGLAFSATWKPAREWLDTAPTTMRTLERKLRPVTRLLAKVESVSEQAGRVAGPIATGDADTSPPVIVDVNATVANTPDWLLAIATILMVTFFLLAGGPALLMRLDVAFGGHESNKRLVQIVATISNNVGRYFAAVTVSNLLLGIGTATTMYFLGMPNALLWGVVAFVFNYIPYAGSATTLVLLTVVAVVSFDDLERVFAVAGCYLVLTTVEGQIVQPVLVGHRLDVSPLLVLLSLWFGGWLWGIAGVALAVPLLASLKALANELRRRAATEPVPAPRAEVAAHAPVRPLPAARHHRRDD